MHRRGFLTASLATVLASPRALAQTKMDDMSMPGMGGHAGHDMAAMVQDAVTLPEGQALRALQVLANEADRPGLLRARLTAEPAIARFAEGRDTPILAYNGISPGPLIEAFEGDRVEITFANRIDNEVSTIHWHGMPVPADQDGSPMDPVAAGTERVYAFELPKAPQAPIGTTRTRTARRQSRSIGVLPAPSSSRPRPIPSRPNMVTRCWCSPISDLPPMARYRATA